VFVGDSNVGKTSLIQNYIHPELTTFATLGATGRRAHSRVDDVMIPSNVWDIAGQQSFHNLVSMLPYL
jgi:GTPase SAR1 family protein